jgi:phospholipase C
VVQQAASPYTLYLQESFSTSTAWQYFTVSFTPTVSDSNVFIGFNLAGSTGSVWIDNVVLSQAGSSPTPVPPTSTAVPSTPTSTPVSSGHAIKTVFVIMMENHNWSDIYGSSSAPYINSLVSGSNDAQTSYATQYYTPPGNHPSLPNYLWLEGGSCFTYCGTDNDPSTPISSTAHLATLLNNAGISWKSYQENIANGTCPTSSSGLYAAKHDPFVYFGDMTGNTSYCTSHIRSFADLSGDLANNSVARYNFITPNLCDDMHDSCAPTNDPIKQGDSWLQANLPAILSSQAYQSGGAVFIIWDEGSSSSDGPIGAIVLSPFAKGHGYNNAIHYTHSSTLRTIEEIFNVSPMLGDAANAPDLSDLFTTFP